MEWAVNIEGRVPSTEDGARSYSCIGTEFCCVIRGRTCDFSVQDQAGRAYACALMIEFGSFEAMNRSPHYREVGMRWVAQGQPYNYCETFDPAFCCRPEFRNGRTNEKSSVVIA